MVKYIYTILIALFFTLVVFGLSTDARDGNINVVYTIDEKGNVNAHATYKLQNIRDVAKAQKISVNQLKSFVQFKNGLKSATFFYIKNISKESLEFVPLRGQANINYSGQLIADNYEGNLDLFMNLKSILPASRSLVLIGKKDYSNDMYEDVGNLTLNNKLRIRLINDYEALSEQEGTVELKSQMLYWMHYFFEKSLEIDKDKQESYSDIYGNVGIYTSTNDVLKDFDEFMKKGTLEYRLEISVEKKGANDSVADVKIYIPKKVVNDYLIKKHVSSDRESCYEKMSKKYNCIDLWDPGLEDSRDPICYGSNYTTFVVDPCDEAYGPKNITYFTNLQKNVSEISLQWLSSQLNLLSFLATAKTRPGLIIESASVKDIDGSEDYYLLHVRMIINTENITKNSQQIIDLSTQDMELSSNAPKVSPEEIFERVTSMELYEADSERMLLFSKIITSLNTISSSILNKLPGNSEVEKIDLNARIKNDIIRIQFIIKEKIRNPNKDINLAEKIVIAEKENIIANINLERSTVDPYEPRYEQILLIKLEGSLENMRNGKTALKNILSTLVGESATLKEENYEEASIEIAEDRIEIDTNYTPKNASLNLASLVPNTKLAEKLKLDREADVKLVLNEKYEVSDRNALTMVNENTLQTKVSSGTYDLTVNVKKKGSLLDFLNTEVLVAGALAVLALIAIGYYVLGRK